VTIIKTAHEVGLPSTATIMYGHIDQPVHWAAHLDLLRAIQKETGGFTELVPLGFVHSDSPLYHRRNDVRPGPTVNESLKMHAVARLMLHGHIDNIQVSWVKLGHALAVKMLQSGANDLGGTLMNESISRAAGATNGQEVTPGEMVQLIRAAGRVPFQRTTLYDEVELFDQHEPPLIDPLVMRHGATPVDFLTYRRFTMPGHNMLIQKLFLELHVNQMMWSHHQSLVDVEGLSCDQGEHC